MLGKEEIADYQHFLHFPQCFQKPSSSRVNETQDCVVMSKNAMNVSPKTHYHLFEWQQSTVPDSIQSQYFPHWQSLALR